MLNETLRGSLVAFMTWALSIFCLYKRLIPTYYFAIVLGMWLIYATHRLFRLLVNRYATPPTDDLDAHEVAYWLGAIGSSLAAPFLWMLIVSRIRVF